MFPGEYPYAHVFARRGIAPVPVLPLRMATAAKIVRRYMVAESIVPSSAKLVFAAPYAAREVCDTVLELSGEVRYIALEVGRGEEELARMLRRTRGVAVCGGEGAALRISFDPEEKASEHILSICDPDVKVEYTLADESIREALLAALFRMGKAEREQIRVLSVSRSQAE